MASSPAPDSLEDTLGGHVTEQQLWAASHLSLFHLYAPVASVKAPISSCWTCMARMCTDGSVGLLFLARSSLVRHKSSLFRNT